MPSSTYDVTCQSPKVSDWSLPLIGQGQLIHPVKTTGRSEINSSWLSDRGLPPWWDRKISTQWIEVPQTHVGVSGGTNGKPI